MSRRRTGRVVVVVGTVLAAGTAAAAATGFGLRAGGGTGGGTGGALPPATATVTRQTLVDTRTEDGTLGHGEATTVNGRLGGTLTALPAVGSTVQRGQSLYRVDNAPIVLLYGALPAYRPLAVGTEGADVKQFEQNLAALGYRGFTVDSTYSASTADAVKRWQQDLGLPRTGVVDLGRVVYAAGPVRVDSHKAVVGDAAPPGAPILAYTGKDRVATVDLAVADQKLAVPGAAVTVKLPDGRSMAGTVASSATVVLPAEGQAPARTKVRVTVTLADQNAPDQAAVQVAFTASKRENVLTVPVAALLALAEGGYGVQVVDGTATRIVPVETGLFSGGHVEVSGAGLAEGATIGMPA